ncbi:MAG TPA: DUF397 domain-containing protein [Trebonia sp.]|jgi:hypothetical protein|nr:DUF397 domain-containing protein [Trebonia sp.]
MDWRKSSCSNATGGSCAECAARPSLVLVRDTTNRSGVTVSVPARAWLSFASDLQAR